MFDDLDFENGKLIKNKSGNDFFADKPISEVNSQKSELDSEVTQELHARLMGFYRQELDRQAQNRYEMAIDEDYYDNIQWDDESAAILRQRGQAPLVYNVISTSVRWVLGTERQAKSDYKILPRRKEESDAAEKKTSLMKYLSDVNRLPFARARAFKDAVVTGLGWLEVGIQDETDNDEMIYSRYESWRNLLWDSAAIESDLSDARYMFRVKWVDIDAAKAMFPNREAQLEAAAQESNRYASISSTDANGDIPMDYPEYSLEEQMTNRAISFNTRKRVRLIECWYKMPSQEKRITKGVFKGEIYDPNEPRHQDYIEHLAERLTYVTHCCVMTVSDMLYMTKSPYRHNKYPFVPLWGYKRGRDGLPYGMVRGLRDIQDDINKRAAKAQYILATNKIIADEDAFGDLEQTRAEAARPDGIILKKRGSDAQLNVDRALADAHLQLMNQGIQMIQMTGGVTDELLARKTNAISGVAIKQRQEQGSLVTSLFFENLLFANQLQGEMWLSLIEQFMVEEKQFRITGSNKVSDFVSINTGLPQDDITQTKADFIVSEIDYRASVRQAQADQLVDLMGKLAPYNPQIAIVMMDLVIDNMDINNKDEVLKRVRQVTGMRDPAQEEPTPEELQAQEAEAQAQAEAQQYQQQIADANLRKLNAEAALKEAEAQVERLTAREKAVNVSVPLAQDSVVAGAADDLLNQTNQ